MKPWTICVAAGILSFSPLGVFGEILKTAMLEEVNTRVEKIAKTVPAREILVIYDVDQTLARPADPALQVTNLRHHRETLRKLFTGLTPRQVESVKLLAIAKTPHVLLDDGVAEKIANLQKSGVPAFALSSLPCGALPGEKGQRPFYAIQAGRLTELGIHFEKAFTFRRVFLQSFSKRDGCVPTYYNGVLLSNGESNGTVLAALLKNCKTLPQHIVAVDSDVSHLKDISKALHKQFPKIHFTGLEYVSTATDEVKTLSDEEFIAFWKPFVERVKKLDIGVAPKLQKQRGK
ncbi:MAG: DUF2608 domain-containing protein [Puniceicoccales bacterium]|nr:DUF2608 domain-containing protein [Puniceicoccales bacterium]